MKLEGALATAMNSQITMELHASLVYRQLAIDVEALDLPGIASWFQAQAAEELEHADKFTQHMLDRGAHPRLEAIPAATGAVTTVLAAFEASLAHEEKVSEAIRDLYRTAQQQGDIDAFPLLNWFVDEQIEEEATASEIVGRVKLIGNDGSGLLKLDSDLGSRGTSAE